MGGREHRTFVAEFVLHPKSIGAVAPSSRGLARRVVGAVDWNSVDAVLEYGPGTGAITEHIVSSLRPETRFIAIELSARFADVIRKRFPDVCVCEDSVANVQSICEQERVHGADAILSGLPWSSFSDSDQTTYLNAMMTVLKPGGKFITFGYLQALLLPGGMRFRKKLRRYFSEVKMSKPVWANLPPAFIYRCIR
jgi:phospholipid N-methyltransferase